MDKKTLEVKKTMNYKDDIIRLIEKVDDSILSLIYGILSEVVRQTADK